MTESDIRALFPNTSFANPFKAPQEYQLVFRAPQPAFDPITNGVRETVPELTEKGTWEQRWEVYALDAATAAANQAAAAKRVEEEIVFNTQKRLDTFARGRNYDGILSACTYATSKTPNFQTEGEYCVQARDATWVKLYQMLAEVHAGTRPMPTGFEAVEPELPVLQWPA